MGICLKVNVMARLEYELANYDSAVHRFNHYITRIHEDCTTWQVRITFNIFAFHSVVLWSAFFAFYTRDSLIQGQRLRALRKLLIEISKLISAIIHLQYITQFFQNPNRFLFPLDNKISLHDLCGVIDNLHSYLWDVWYSWILFILQWYGWF